MGGHYSACTYLKVGSAIAVSHRLIIHSEPVQTIKYSVGIAVSSGRQLRVPVQICARGK